MEDSFREMGRAFSVEMMFEMTLVLPCHLTLVKIIQVAHPQDRVGNYPLTPLPLVIGSDSAWLIPADQEMSVPLLPIGPGSVCCRICTGAVLMRLVSDGEPAAGK